jgi:hypothetical protein
MCRMWLIKCLYSTYTDAYLYNYILFRSILIKYWQSRICTMSSAVLNDDLIHYSAAYDRQLLELIGFQSLPEQAAVELTVEELQRQNELLRQYVVKLLDESEQLKERLKESDRENRQLESKLSSAEALELERYGVLEF